jgi:DNA-binding HxlR family transcriptional regulator
MATILKNNVTTNHNLRILENTTEVNDVLRTISTRWKMMILYDISQGVNQLNKIKAAFPTASDHMLTQRLRELESEKFIEKHVEGNAEPVQISYSLTTKSRALLQIIKQLQQWGLHWKD